MRKFWRWLLRVSFDKVYPDVNVLVDEINSETWMGAKIETGGHALRDCKLSRCVCRVFLSVCCILDAKTCD